MSQQDALIEQIRAGNRQLQDMAADGLVPLPPEKLIPLQVELAETADLDLRQKAMASLHNHEPSILVPFLKGQADERTMGYFATNVRRPEVVETLLARRDVPRQILMAMAPLLDADGQERLLLRQDAIVEEPKILVELERNPNLSSYAKRRMWEYREHLLPRDKVPPKKAEDVLAEVDTWTEEDVSEAIGAARGKPPEGDVVVDPEEKPGDPLAGLTDVQIRGLPVPVRIKLARGADRQMRGLLIRDANSQVALATLLDNSVPDQEVEQIANNRAVLGEVLEAISKKRDWIRKYTIARALVKNPRTPQMISIRLVPRMVPRDLRELSRDKNVPDAVRSRARRLYQAKR